MFRVIIVLLGFIFLINEGVAIRCYVCSSLYDKGCDDQHFTGDPKYMYDCSADPLRGIIPVQHCRKTKYFTNDKWIYVRSCNKRDNLTDAKDGEVINLCHADFCNSAIKLNSRTPILLIVVFVARFLLH